MMRDLATQCKPLLTFRFKCVKKVLLKMADPAEQAVSGGRSTQIKYLSKNIDTYHKILLH